MNTKSDELNYDKAQARKYMVKCLSAIFALPMAGMVFLLVMLCMDGCYQPDEIVEMPNGSIRIYHTAKGLDPLSRTFVPGGAANIRMYYRGGFGGQSYSVSCHVSQKDLEVFARKEEYVFSPRAFNDGKSWTHLLYLYDEDDPVLCNAPKVRNGLPVNHHFDGYMVSEKEHDGRCYKFLYDKKCEMLYIRYWD